jgi:hypothetical protein
MIPLASTPPAIQDGLATLSPSPLTGEAELKDRSPYKDHYKPTEPTTGAPNVSISELLFTLSPLGTPLAGQSHGRRKFKPQKDAVTVNPPSPLASLLTPGSLLNEPLLNEPRRGSQGRSLKPNLKDQFPFRDHKPLESKTGPRDISSPFRLPISPPALQDDLESESAASSEAP